MTARTSSGKHSVPKERVRAALSRDWFDTAQRVGKGALFDATGAKCIDTINNVITEQSSGLPELHTALNSLLADDAALFNTFQLFDGCFVRVSAEAGNDMATISQMLHAATDYLDRMKDGQRCHQDTASLAKLFTPLIPAMLAITLQADRQRGAA